MTDLSPLLAEARRIAEEVQASADACMAAIKGNRPGIAAAMEEYRDKADDLAPRLAAALLALIPVVEAAETGALHMSTETRFGEEAFERLYSALKEASTTLTEALK